MIQFNYTLLYNIIMYIMTMYYNLFYNMYCVTVSSVNMFKNKVDTYLRRAGYK